MELITLRQLVEANRTLSYLGGEAAARIIFRILKLDKVNALYSKYYNLPPFEMIDKLLEDLDVHFEIPGSGLENIPAGGSFITISNHPYGGLEGLLLVRLIGSVRPDFKVLVNFLLTRIEPLSPVFLGVNPFETYKDVRSSYGGLKDAFVHLAGNHPLGIFPAGEVSSFKIRPRAVTDKEWQMSIIKLIKKASVPIIPVYFPGHNGWIFQSLGMIHPMLRTVRLPSELLNKKGQSLKIQIGSPIPVKEQDHFTDYREYGKFLRMRTYSLGLALKTDPKPYRFHHSAPEKIATETPRQTLRAAVETLPGDYLLFRLNEFDVFSAPSSRIPAIMTEIGRLREITYRDVGEGTGKSSDLDEYDTYFDQLFIWDGAEGRIVGGYRVGYGRELLKHKGVHGFYISSLFHVQQDIAPVLSISIELGRSFICKEYQKRIHSLFLLWKGILYLLLKNPDYRYLIGPVSISNEFRLISKILVTEFLKANYLNTEYSDYIRPKNPFRYRIPREIRKSVFLKYLGKDPGQVDKFIQDIDPGFRLPVLMRKYLSVNAEVIGFNVDPAFNYCLDALMILDVLEVPFEMIEALSKEMNDQSILERFRK